MQLPRVSPEMCVLMCVLMKISSVVKCEPQFMNLLLDLHERTMVTLFQFRQSPFLHTIIAVAQINERTIFLKPLEYTYPLQLQLQLQL